MSEEVRNSDAGTSRNERYAYRFRSGGLGGKGESSSPLPEENETTKPTP